jgi:hypothetical protein
MAWRNESETASAGNIGRHQWQSISLAMSAKAKNNENRKRNKMWRNKMANGEMSCRNEENNQRMRIEMSKMKENGVSKK